MTAGETKTNRGTSRARQRGLTVVAVVALAVATAVVYTDVMTFQPAATASSGYPDTQNYLAMYQGDVGRGHHGYRILVPFLAGLVPNPPVGLFSERPNPARVIAYKFGVVNLIFLVGAALLLHLLQTGLGLRYLESLLGIVLFLGSVPVVRSAGLPMTDTAFYFFLVLSLLAVQGDRPGWLVAAVGIGVLAKELVLLVLFALLLTHLPVRRKGWHLAALVPGAAIYIGLRLTLEEAGAGAYNILVADPEARLAQSLGHLSTLDGLVDFFILSFGAAWLPAAWAAFGCRLPPLLKRWAWLVPIVFVGVLTGGGNLGRSTFTAFPIVMPLAALGLGSWLTGLRDFSDRARAFGTEGK